jgi:hypothetical protein
MSAHPQAPARRSFLILGAMAALAAGAASAPAFAAGKSVTVLQGNVGRWSGEGIERCGMDGKAWQPVDGTCWYPVDFQRSPGKAEIARWLESTTRSISALPPGRWRTVPWC